MSRKEHGRAIIMFRINAPHSFLPYQSNSLLQALVESIKKKPKFFPERMREISNWNKRGTQAFKKAQNMRSLVKQQ